MREIRTSDVESQLSHLLDDVERGEIAIFTRDGTPIARLAAEVAPRREEVERAIAGIRELRRTAAKMTVDEIVAAKHAGHRY